MRGMVFRVELRRYDFLSRQYGPLETSKTPKSLAIESKQTGKRTMTYILLKLPMATIILKKQKRNLQLMMIIIVRRLAVPMVNGEVVLIVLIYHTKQLIV